MTGVQTCALPILQVANLGQEVAYKIGGNALHRTSGGRARGSRLRGRLRDGARGGIGLVPREPPLRRIAADLGDEGVIDQRTAVLRVEPKQLDTLLHPQFDAAALKAAEAIGKGLAASPGSACGRVVFSAEDAEEKVKDEAWKKVVLVRLETFTDISWLAPFLNASLRTAISQPWILFLSI